MKKIIGISFVLCLCITGMSQSYITQKEYSVEPVLINPAICGADNIPKATLSYTRQWTGIRQAPSSFYVSGEMRLGKYGFYNPRMFINTSKFRSLERVGLGAGLYTDINGPFQEFNLLLTYSYHLSLNESTHLSFGITGKINHFGVNNSDLHPRDVNDPLINFGSYTNVNSNAGMYLYHSEYFTGISVVDLFRNNAGNMVYNSSQRGFYIMGGYRFKNDNASLILEPSVTGKFYMEQQKRQFDYHVKLYFPKYGWLGFSFIDGNQLEFIAAVHVLKSYYIAYRFATVQGVTTYTGNNHGIILAKNLGVSRNTAINY